MKPKIFVIVLASLAFQTLAQTVGIGSSTFTPGSMLSVDGNMSIGNGYRATANGVTNGLIVEGNVGVGTTTVAAKLDVVHSTDAYVGHFQGNRAGSTGVSITNTNTANGAFLSLGETSSSTVATPFYILRYGSTAGGGNAYGVTLNNSQAGYMNFFTNGVERIRILSDGNVGIGTTTPNFRLDALQSTGGTYPAINISEQNTTNRRATIGFGLNAAVNTGWIFGQSSGNNTTKDFYLYDVTNAAFRLLIKDDGNVGIATTAPASKLSVIGSSYFGSGGNEGSGFKLHVSGANAKTSSTANAPLMLSSSDALASNPLVLSFDVVGNATAGSRYGSVEVSEFGTGNYRNLTLQPNGGNTGIGTTIPGAKLHVNGVTFLTAGGGTANGNFILESVGQVFLQGGGGLGSLFNYDGAAGYDTYIRPGQSAAGSDVIMDYGNVGIGITTPTVKLDVRGPMYVPTTGFKTVAELYSTDALGADVGAGLALGGRYSGTTPTHFAEIAGVKLNATDGDYSGHMIFSTRLNGNTAMLERVRIDHNGNVGIGITAPAYTLAVTGTVGCSSTTVFTNYSDARLKTNVQTINSTLDKILALRPVQFNWNNEYLSLYNDTISFNSLRKGFIAQEVKGKEYYDLNLSNLQVYIVKAMQEQQKIIEQLQKTNAEHLQRIDTLEKLQRLTGKD